MVEIFTTSIENKIEVDKILNIFKIELPELKIAFDLEDIYNSYPCGHSIMRIEGTEIISEKIITIINKQGFNCEILEDKICLKK